MIKMTMAMDMAVVKRMITETIMVVLMEKETVVGRATNRMN
jgi:small nuclear ribonucleoprotein (snRNP)-like protein